MPSSILTIQSWCVVGRVPIFVCDVVAIEADLVPRMVVIAVDRPRPTVVIEAALARIVIAIMTIRADLLRESLLRNVRPLKLDPNHQRLKASLKPLALDRDIPLRDRVVPALHRDVLSPVHAPAPVLPILIEINPLEH